MYCKANKGLIITKLIRVLESVIKHKTVFKKEDHQMKIYRKVESNMQTAYGSNICILAVP